MHVDSLMFYVYSEYIYHAVNGCHTILNAISEQAKGGASNMYVFSLVVPSILVHSTPGDMEYILWTSVTN